MENNEKNKWEEAAKKIVEESEGTADDALFQEVGNDQNEQIQPDISAYDKLKDIQNIQTENIKVENNLGKASTYGRKNDDEAELEDLRSKFGYIDLVMMNLPSRGKFYPDGTKISIRAAKVQEVREFSTMEETNLFDVDDKLNNILLACTKVELGKGRKGSYKDILEEDRIFIILSIRELTFKDGENKLTHKAICRQCDTENVYDLRTNNLQYHEIDEALEKYYHEELKCYAIQTKTSGTIKMAPPKIGVMKVVTAAIKEKEEKREKWDKSFHQLVPYIQTEWRNFDNDTLFDRQVEFQGWSMNKFGVVYRMAEKMKIGVKQELIHPCEKCGAEVTVPITFRGGLKSLFIIQDPGDELI